MMDRKDLIMGLAAELVRQIDLNTFVDPLGHRAKDLSVFEDLKKVLLNENIPPLEIPPERFPR